VPPAVRRSPLGRIGFVRSGHDAPVRPHSVLDVLAARRSEGSVPGERSDPHRVALAVEGGGSRATYSSGMVLALEELGLAECFDDVYGASAGALAGSWLVAAEAAHCCAGWWRPGLMERVTSPGRGLRGRPVVDVEYLVQTVGETIVPLTWQSVLDSRVPLHPIATDVETGEAVDLHDTIVDKASLQKALRASACVPVLAGLPIEIGGRRYVDAAVAEPIPFHTALAQGATHVLVLRTRRADQVAVEVSRLEKALVSRLGAARVPGLVQVLGSRLENRRADDDRLARASAGLAGDDPPHLLEIRPPEGSDTINPLETDPDVLRRGVEVGRNAVYGVLDHEADERTAS
jgi:predicted patatin/cPLA2 family phospholipase